ncbi:hypothetical protein H114_00757 [Streptomyces gancidicus BKS 13-15]|uniref:Uncharacterized protein n=1 Tax=Streptomyces gancidicus BKS 13-15 TaxID=1284664 RepID=M3C412_STREZ|nr:hypothetical protein H114_00757 [Streptomyces gancidicus BKS 13-15]
MEVLGASAGGADGFGSFPAYTTSDSVQPTLCLLPGDRPAVAFLPPFASPAIGVGSSFGARLSSDGRGVAPGLADWFDPYGVAVGVGSSASPCGLLSSVRPAPRPYMISVDDAPREALGVGSSRRAPAPSGRRCSTSSASVGPWLPCFRLSGCCDPPFTASCAVGVLRSFTATGGGESEKPRPRPSLARGVGRFAILARRVSFLGPSSRPGPLCSFVVGVGRSSPDGEDELAEPLVRRPDLRSRKALPFRIEPEAGQVAEYNSECPHSRLTFSVSQAPRAGFHVAMGWGREDAAHIFDHHQLGL